MLHRFPHLHLIFSVFCASLHANLQVNPQMEMGAHFPSLKEEVENRWRAFQKNREFLPFAPGKSDEELQKEFEVLHDTRQFLWTTLGYDVAPQLLTGDLIRAVGCGAFAYNNTVPYYNASTIWLRDKYYIACEGPRSKDIPSFFHLLTAHHVTHLVRLTDSYEGEIKKCHPYWKGLVASEGYLHIPREGGDLYPVRAFDMAHWRDNQGVDPEELLHLVLQVRKEIAEEGTLLLVHCSAGVGRTGTFLAALAIVDAIERNEPFSIEEIVYRLSLQRVHSVGKFGQYITLHRLAENYLKQKV